MWEALLILVLVIIIAAYFLNIAKFIIHGGRTDDYIVPICVKSHQPSGLNYPWLNGINGGLQKITFEEPAGSGVWRDYTDKIWKIHCKVVNHNPGELVSAHMKAFVDPETRFARLNFHFRDGTVMEPTREFYEMEERWFANNVPKK